MSLQDIIREFPHLQIGDFVKTSDDDDGYNCIAWAIDSGRTDTRWDPTPLPGNYWPLDVPPGYTLDVFIVLYQKRCGYEPCDNGELEDGYEKLALYVDSYNEFAHVARQLPSGWWTSKLGDFDDISHITPFVLEADYGKVMAFMKRKRQTI